jgi:DNA polymerase III subunit alpha
MENKDFIHLRLHSAYSLAEGAIHVKDLVKLCHDHQMPAVAVTDTNNMFGALDVSLSLPESGIQPIIGCTIAIRHPAAPCYWLKAKRGIKILWFW